MEAYIYTYVNKETGKTYIGSRSAYKGSCFDDFNIKYFSSSRDKQFRQDMADGKLEGQIVLVMDDEIASKKIIDVESKMITAYWEKYGKENSYNHHNNNSKWSTAGSHPIFSEERNKKISEKLKGKPSKLKGKKRVLSEEGRLSVIEHNKNRVISEETKKKISEKAKARPRKPHSEETKMKMSEWQIGKELSPETKKKISESHKGKHWKLNEFGKRVYY